MYNNSLFQEPCGGHDNASRISPTPITRHRRPGYRTADLILNKQDILSTISFTDDTIPIPIVSGISHIEFPREAIPFSRAIHGATTDALMVFYEPDVNFARILHNPKRYVPVLKRFHYVAGPDFSQKIGMTPFIRFSNSWWNKPLSAFYQANGVQIIPNVTWSGQDSLSYAFKGLPQDSVIAINSNGVIGNHAAIYLWRRGYEAAVQALNPRLIIRYGDRLPGEHEDISLYFENLNLKRLRNGSKRITY